MVWKTLLQDLETNADLLKRISDSLQYRTLTIKIASFYKRVFTMPIERLVRMFTCSQSISLKKDLPGPERGVAIQIFILVTFIERILTF